MANKNHPLQVPKDQGKTWSYTGVEPSFVIQPGLSQIMYYNGVLYATGISDVGNPVAVVMYSDDKGQSWHSSLVDNSGVKIVNISQLTHSYGDDHNLYLISGSEDNPIPSKIYYSSNQGESWHDLNIDLFALPVVLNQPGISSVYVFGNEMYMTVIGEDPISGNNVANLYYSKDYGKHFLKMNMLNGELPYKVYARAGVLYVFAIGDLGALLQFDL